MRSARKAKAQNELKLVGRKKAKDKQKLKKKNLCRRRRTCKVLACGLGNEVQYLQMTSTVLVLLCLSRQENAFQTPQKPTNKQDRQSVSSSKYLLVGMSLPKNYC
jgi:hypothetical protein